MSAPRTKTFIGERKQSRRKLPAGFRIDRITDTFAYAKSGNAHNPTPRFHWEVFQGEVRVATVFSEAAAVRAVTFYSTMSDDSRA